METANAALIAENEARGYVYCKKHDIFYSRKLAEQNAQAIKDLVCSDEEERMLWSLSMHACPLCKAGLRASLMLTMGSASENSQYENFREGDILFELALERERDKAK